MQNRRAIMYQDIFLLAADARIGNPGLDSHGYFAQQPVISDIAQVATTANKTVRITNIPENILIVIIITHTIPKKANSCLVTSMDCI